MVLAVVPPNQEDPCVAAAAVAAPSSVCCKEWVLVLVLLPRHCLCEAVIPCAFVSALEHAVKATGFEGDHQLLAVLDACSQVIASPPAREDACIAAAAVASCFRSSSSGCGCLRRLLQICSHVDDS